jgi:hypothetical protein
MYTLNIVQKYSKVFKMATTSCSIQEAFSGKFANLLANGWKKQLTKVETYF